MKKQCQKNAGMIPDDASNRIASESNRNPSTAEGWTSVSDTVIGSFKAVLANKQHALVCLDGYMGTDWDRVRSELQAAVNRADIRSEWHAVDLCRKDGSRIEKMLKPYVKDDPVFGKLYKGLLSRFFDRKKSSSFRSTVISGLKVKGTKPKVVFVWGTGAALGLFRFVFDRIIYFDLTRQELLLRQREWSRISGKTQSISPKSLYYVEFQINDWHRNRVFQKCDDYVDGNRSDCPVMVSVKTLRWIAGEIARQPFRLKPIYEPGPWGGQWLKKIRHLPESWVNCAWSYEVIAQEMSLVVEWDERKMEIPWNTFFHFEYDSVMGNVPKRRFAGQFPIRYDYLDTMQGGDLSIQVHPTTPYIRRQFGEPYHQGEMYYIVAARPGARVNVGLNESMDKDAFLQAARNADGKGIPFDYREFVNSVPSHAHDLILIPPGTVHGSGEGQVVLEISATTYRYTFKIYDHLRPGLDHRMRPIHIDHAFRVIKWFRRTSWVQRHLVQEPVLVRSGQDWAEYAIGDRPEFFHVVFRLEFRKQIMDRTRGQFHVLTMVEGECVRIESERNTKRCLLLRYSETAVVPAIFGEYRIENLGNTPCKIAKARLRE